MRSSTRVVQGVQIVALSDWRTQPIEHVHVGLDSLGFKPDLLLYGGDDVARFGSAAYVESNERMHPHQLRWNLHHSIRRPRRHTLGQLAFHPHRDFDIFSVKHPEEDPDAAIKVIDRQMPWVLTQWWGRQRRSVAALTPLVEALGRPRTYARVRDRIVDEFDRERLPLKGLTVFLRRKGADAINEFSRLARRSSLGVHGVVGNDCHPSDRGVLRAPGVHDLHRRPFVLRGFGFIGLEAAPGEYSTLRYDERAAIDHLNAAAARLPQGLPLVIVSHAPPFGVLDLAARFGVENIGSRGLRSFIRTHDVRLVLCGHAHLGGGKSQQLDKCLVVNTANHDDDHSPGRIAVVDLDAGGAAVRWVVPQTLTTDALADCQRPHKERLAAAGIKLLSDVHALSEQQIGEISGVTSRTARKWLAHARAQRYRRFVQLQPPAPLPDQSIFYDIETMPGGQRPEIWLVGVLDPGTDRVRQFLAKTTKDEVRILRAFIEYLDERPGWALVSFSSFDPRRLTERLRRYSGSWARRFAARAKIDLYKWLRTAVVPPSHRYNLKDLSRALGIGHDQHEHDGTSLAFTYLARALGRRVAMPWSKALQYNREDVQVLPRIIARVKCDLESPRSTSAASSLPAR